MKKLTFFAALALSGAFALPAFARPMEERSVYIPPTDVVAKDLPNILPKHSKARTSGARTASSGIASFYGGGEKLNRHTANGEVFRPNAMTAAHRTLPLGSLVLVTNQNSGRSCTVRINDRGPAAWTGRIIDLSRGAAHACGINGLGSVKLETIS